jgi:hypothetical protein
LETNNGASVRETYQVDGTARLPSANVYQIVSYVDPNVKTPEYLALVHVKTRMFFRGRNLNIIP